ncbi:hypothetical protein ACI48J_03755 [Paenibacillus chitinolyticus]|uniref:hypothetical protein n=1 Tax=Paenibacillus chitinolyticus TaxID=79263 RepID=UPI00386B83A5
MSKKTYFIVSLLVSLLSVLSVYYKCMEKLDAGLLTPEGVDNASALGLGLIIFPFLTAIFHLSLHAFLFYYVIANKKFKYIELSIIYIKRDPVTLNIIRLLS